MRLKKGRSIPTRQQTTSTLCSNMTDQFFGLPKLKMKYPAAAVFIRRKGLDNDCAELVKFYLKRKERGKGLGKKLILKSFQSSGEMGYKRLYLESLPQFLRAVSMYEKLKFKN